MRTDFDTLVGKPFLAQPEAGAAKTGDGVRRNRRIPARARARFLRVVRGRAPASSDRAEPAATTATVRSFGHFSVWINRYYGDRESAGLPVENLQRGQFLRLKIIVYNDLAYQFLPFGPIPTPGMNADLHEHLHSLAQPMIFMKIHSCL